MAAAAPAIAPRARSGQSAAARETKRDAGDVGKAKNSESDNEAGDGAGDNDQEAKAVDGGEANKLAMLKTIFVAVFGRTCDPALADSRDCDFCRRRDSGANLFNVATGLVYLGVRVAADGVGRPSLRHAVVCAACTPKCQALYHDALACHRAAPVAPV